MLNKGYFVISFLFVLAVCTNAFALTVNTNDIADGAVTSQKIADGSVSTPKIADGAITTDKVSDSAVTSGKIADGAITSNKVADGAVTTGAIANGAVTDSKITGPISASKISSAGLNADTVDGVHASELAPAVHTHAQSQVIGLEAALAAKSDTGHNHDGSYQKKYAKIAVIAKAGGDYTDIFLATNDLSSWCGTPSATNRCLMKIMPGVYDHRGWNFEVTAYLAVEGSGEEVTRLINTTAFMYSNSAMRALTIENQNIGIWAYHANPYTLENVTLNITDANDRNGYPGFGILNDYCSSFALKNVTVNVSGPGPFYGIWNLYSSGNMKGVSLNAPGSTTGIYNTGGSVKIDYSSIAAPQTILSEGASTYVAYSNIVGSNPAAVAGGVVKCMGLFNNNYDPVTCP